MWNINSRETNRKAREDFERMALAKLFGVGSLVLFGVCLAIERAQAQFVNPVPPPPPPVFNPSSPYTVPQARETPVSPNSSSGDLRGSGALLQLPPARAPCSVLSGRPCHPSFCGVYHRGPCFPQYLPAIGENLQLTIVSTDDNDPGNNLGGGGKSADTRTNGDNADKSLGQAPLDSIGEMYAALRTCWVPPPRDSARHGMEYTVRFSFKHNGEIIAPPFVTYVSHDAPAEVRGFYRDAVNAALARCTPLHFSDGMAGALAGRPIAVRFVDDRTIESEKSLH